MDPTDDTSTTAASAVDSTPAASDQTSTAPAPDGGAANTPAATSTPVAKTEAQRDTEALDALDRGIQQADGIAANADAPESKPAETPKPATTPEEQAAAARKTADDTDAAEVTAEIAKLGLKKEAGERFRAMHNELRDARPLLTAAKEAGIKNANDIPLLLSRAKAADAWESEVQKTGANAEQIGMLFDYARLVNQNTPEALKQAFDMMQREAAAVGKLLGIQAGGYDPLEEHPDLKELVDNGDMSSEAALKVVESRARDNLSTTQHQVAQRATESETASAQGRADLTALGKDLAKSDPHYNAKQSLLVNFLQQITPLTPPSEWVQRATNFYRTLPNPSPAPARVPPVGHVERRPVSPSPNALAKTSFANEMEALDAGIARASQVA